MPFALSPIRQALAQHRPQRVEPEPHHTQAAVALVLAGDPELALCFIRRSEREDDPWSGHMALPGGRASADDPHPEAVAERETFEEVGLALAPHHRLGALSHVPVRMGGGDPREVRMVLSPFVYYLGPELAPFSPDAQEVAEAFWVPLAHLWDPANASHVEWERSGKRLVYPAIRFRGHSIWGLTFRVLTLFSDVLDAPLPHLEEIPGLGV
jgi:8-oxo-dGTP pyrophosphatase MutT (NUDIX family)